MRDIIIHRSRPRRTTARSAAAALLTFLAAACAGSSASSDGGTESLEVVRRAPAVYRTYEVTGSTANEIARSLRENSPQSEGRRPAGLTTWDIRWNARWAGNGALCRVTELDVPLRVEVLMPHWERPPGASDQLARDWDTFLAALSRHEAGHVDLASEAAREVRRALSGVTAPTCAAMESRMRAEGDRVIQDYNQRQRWYDERTNRGATQGVAWPPTLRDGWDGIAGVNALRRLPIIHRFRSPRAGLSARIIIATCCHSEGGAAQTPTAAPEIGAD